MTETCRDMSPDTTQNVAIWAQKRHADIRHNGLRPAEGSVSTAYDHLYRHIAYNWGFNQRHSLTVMNGLLSITVKVRVRLESGESPPYKYTT